jgi:hypothetical protein
MPSSTHKIRNCHRCNIQLEREKIAICTNCKDFLKDPYQMCNTSDCLLKSRFSKNYSKIFQDRGINCPDNMIFLICDHCNEIIESCEPDDKFFKLAIMLDRAIENNDVITRYVKKK